MVPISDNTQKHVPLLEKFVTYMNAGGSFDTDDSEWRKHEGQDT